MVTTKQTSQRTGQKLNNTVLSHEISTNLCARVTGQSHAIHSPLTLTHNNQSVLIKKLNSNMQCECYTFDDSMSRVHLKCSSSSSSQLDESAEHSELAQCLLGGEREGEREKECARLGDLQNKITKR